jgi:hypothetical protein
MYIRRRRKSARRIIRACVIVIAAMALAVISILSVETNAQRKEALLASAKKAGSLAVGDKAASELDEPTDASSQVNGKWYGLCPKNSIHSVEDFRRAVLRDPVLAQYYADFDWDRAKTQRLHEPASVFVAYRKDNFIQYTKRPITLPSGDVYLSDGNRNVRSFCCNDFADAPQPGAEEAVSQPMPSTHPPFAYMPDNDPGGVASVPAQPLGFSRPSVSYPSSSPPGGGASYPSKRSPTPLTPVPVPEPGTFFLFGSGAIGIWLMRRVRGRRKK